MGACNGKGAESTVESKEIEKQIQSEKRNFKKIVRLLILGAGESGKTTLCKQFQMINGLFTEEDRRKYGNALQTSLIQYMKILIQAADHLNVSIGLKKDAETFLDFEGTLTPDVGQTIARLWEDAGIQEVFQARNRLFTLPDSCQTLFNRVKEISQTTYIPTNDDCLRVRLRTIGITEYQMLIKELLFKIIDVGGQRNARRKWIHCFDGVNCLLYCIALDDYSMVVAEDLKTNRMLESVKLFIDVLSIEALASVPLIIFFNKVDMLQEKIKVFNLSDLFSEYKGGADDKQALEFIKNQYVQQIPPARNHYCHVTNALDEKNIKFVFEAVKDLLLNAALADGGF
mmetsp:Transcript_53380/g.134046  ORF Transcript_53380/g.134046 Transcript_53380/m.134046 type:complete len:343 (-) Transcript_53380:49-1077(-)